MSTQNPSLQTTEDFCKFIETEVLTIIKDLAAAGTTPSERIQEMAKLTLSLINPQMSLEELYQNTVKLDDTYSELAPVVFMVMKEYEQKYAKSTLQEVSGLVKTKQYDQATDMVKKVLDYKIMS